MPNPVEGLLEVYKDTVEVNDWVADKADRSVVLALLQVAFLGKSDD